MIFSKGWSGVTDKSIYLHESDKLEDKYKKISEIKEYLKNPSFYPFRTSGWLEHEIMIDRPIPLDKYLISINCVCSKEYKKKIKKIVKLKYPRVKILNCPKNEKGLSIPY